LIDGTLTGGWALRASASVSTLAPLPRPLHQVDVTTGDGVFRAACPSGASTGIYEALELRDGGSPYMGKGVSKALANIHDVLAPALIGKDASAQRELDDLMVKTLDGSKNEYGWAKSNLGANAILPVSMALARAGAAAAKLPLYAYIATLAGRAPESACVLPIPAFNVINGGEHAGNQLAMQEFMILPVGAASFSEAMRMGSEVYHNLKSLLKKKYGQDSVNVGDEGGFAPNISSAEEGLDLLVAAIDKAGYSGKVVIGMDVAASEFATGASPQAYDLGKKSAEPGGKGIITGEALLALYARLAAKYPIVSIEDGFEQDDFERWAALTASKLPTPLNGTMQVVGDDLLVTNPTRIARCIDNGACNALLLKVNQIGSLTESIQAVLDAQAAGWRVMASHRSGETEDSFIADLAVGLSTMQIKTGAPCRSERLAKYNQLLRIEQELGARAVYPGASVFGPAK
jgi:enolase